MFQNYIKIGVSTVAGVVAVAKAFATVAGQVAGGRRGKIR
jgi:hypothetical protein